MVLVQLAVAEIMRRFFSFFRHLLKTSLGLQRLLQKRREIANHAELKV